MRRLPWWLRPWHSYRASRSYGMSLQHRIDSLCETAELDIAAIRALEAANTELQRQLGVAAGTLTPEGRPSTGRALLGYEQRGGARPEFVIVGLDRGAAGGKRIYVSRDLAGPSFGIPAGASPVWKLECSMGNMLVIDKATYGLAMEQMAATWRNWDADAASQHRPQAVPELEGSDPRD